MSASEPRTVVIDSYSASSRPGPHPRDTEECIGTRRSPATPRTVVEAELDQGIAYLKEYLGILGQGRSLLFSARFLDGRSGPVSCPPYPMSAACLPEARLFYLQTKLALAKSRISAEEWKGLKRRYGVNRESYFQFISE
ncbi:hypothetical protein BJX76DRAFT_368778 [Aspergillus varians]|uniref:Uncharacterized protein n=1 Tax=Aspergillus sydowii CBS 593.65 TaxID=1036612 RepID=A0A1L9TTE0_9EURO|nr:uncharacterized protein ASPSYDRAFT_65793 [Aspergillus sydowii CBS 593.65]OJJ62684.1 hypothetical protein ASPSYDRAFT_65793 [Aspergillus sydowii CBS 593.65]